MFFKQISSYLYKTVCIVYILESSKKLVIMKSCCLKLKKKVVAKDAKVVSDFFSDLVSKSKTERKKSTKKIC